MTGEMQEDGAPAQLLLDRCPWDGRAPEMDQHAQLKVTAGLPIYFCDAQSPWAARQRRRTPTDCCDSTSRKVPTSPVTGL